MSSITALYAGYDLNALRRAGMYSVVDPLNAPTATGEFLIEVIAANIGGFARTSQIATAVDTGRRYTRARVSDWGAWEISAGGPAPSAQEVITAARTYYLSPTGSNANNGLTVGAPWQTIQYAVQWIRANIDLGGYPVTLQLADGDYAGFNDSSGEIALDGRLIIAGNTGDRNAVTISKHPTTNACITVSKGSYTFQNLSLTPASPCTNAVNAAGAGTTVNFQNSRFAGSLAANGAYFLFATNSSLVCNSSCYINTTGNIARFLDAASGGRINCGTLVLQSNLTISGTSASFARAANFGQVNLNTLTLGSFTVTGVRANASVGGFVSATSLANYGTTDGAVTFNGFIVEGSRPLNYFTPMEVRGSNAATPTASQILLRYLPTRNIRFPANFAGSRARVGTNPTASFVMSVLADATTIGTITVATNGTVTFATTGAIEQVVAKTTIITVVAPATPDATVATLDFTLLGNDGG